MLVVFVVIGAGLGILVDELARLTVEQAALRRIATLVAAGVPPVELFSAVADEVAALLLADGASVVTSEPDAFRHDPRRRGRRADELVWGALAGRTAYGTGDGLADPATGAH